LSAIECRSCLPGVGRFRKTGIVAPQTPDAKTKSPEAHFASGPLDAWGKSALP